MDEIINILLQIGFKKIDYNKFIYNEKIRVSFVEKYKTIYMYYQYIDGDNVALYNMIGKNDIIKFFKIKFKIEYRKSQIEKILC